MIEAQQAAKALAAVDRFGVMYENSIDVVFTTDFGEGLKSPPIRFRDMIEMGQLYWRALCTVVAQWVEWPRQGAGAPCRRCRSLGRWDSTDPFTIYQPVTAYARCLDGASAPMAPSASPAATTVSSTRPRCHRRTRGRSGHPGHRRGGGSADHRRALPERDLSHAARGGQCQRRWSFGWAGTKSAGRLAVAALPSCHRGQASIQPCLSMSRRATRTQKPADSSEDALYERIARIIDAARTDVARSVNTAMVHAYWLIGREIVEVEQAGELRAGYGEQVLDRLAARLTKAFGRGFSPRTLRRVRQFYLTYPSGSVLPPELGGPEKRSALLSKSSTEEIRSALLSKSSAPRELLFPAALGWSHYLILTRVENEHART
jgi:hypothetical protein